MELTIDERPIEGLTVVTVGGDIDVFTSPRLRETLLELIEKGQVDLLVDLGEVEFLDSTGLGVLVGIHHRLRNREGSMSLVGGNERVRRVFHVTQLDRIFTLHPTLDDAIHSLRGT
jgi:anti-sigma B factor antagonist